MQAALLGTWSAYLMLMGATFAGRLASCSNRYMMDRVTIPSSESPAQQRCDVACEQVHDRPHQNPIVRATCITTLQYSC